jgi:hypothetical protein
MYEIIGIGSAFLEETGVLFSTSSALAVAHALRKYRLLFACRGRHHTSPSQLHGIEEN